MVDFEFEILKIVPVRVSTESNVRISFDSKVAITTYFNRTVLDKHDRFHLIQDVINRGLNLDKKGARLIRFMLDKLVEHKHYIDKYVLNMPVILD